MKEAKIIVRQNFMSKSEEEKKQILKKNIVRLLVKESMKFPQI